MKQYLLTFLFYLTFFNLKAQPKREFRGVWIAHVNNIDFPSSANLSESQQKDQFVAILEDFKRNGINAVIIQIRTNGDASYPSNLVPWSAFWTGKQGVGPSYDPLGFMIDECHKRGLEFHAWFNPYRVAPSRTTFAANNHVRITHPQWILDYNGLQLLDPALPEVREHVTQVTMEVVRRYDIDAVHFDDYFYPYPVTGVALNDDASFVNHSRNFTSKEDWRRDNINLLIKMVSDSIKAAKPYVKFGISPFGIWKNKSSTQPDGSDTRGLESFNAIYADSRKWVQEGWIDYIAPQIYWSIGFSVANFAILAPWWASNTGTRNRHLYIGHAAYRINNGGTDANWSNPTEMPNQIKIIRNTPSVSGSIFYNTTTFRGNRLGFNDSLKQHLYTIPALVPTMQWIDGFAPTAPTNLTATRRETGIELNWTAPTAGISEFDRIKRYVVYRFIGNETVDIAKATAIRHITPTHTTTYLDTFSVESTSRFTYVVTAVDRLHNESVPSAAAALIISSSNNVAASRLILDAPIPNPFTDQVTLRFQLDNTERISLDVFDLTGRKIATITEGVKSAGQHEEIFDGSHLTNGVYIVVLSSKNRRLSQRLVKSF